MYCFLSQLVISPQSGSSVNFFFTFANFFSNAKFFTNFFTNSKYFSKANSLQMPNTFSNAKSSTANFPRRGSVALLISRLDLNNFFSNANFLTNFFTNAKSSMLISPEEARPAAWSSTALSCLPTS